MKNLIKGDLKKARILILNMENDINAAMDDPDMDVNLLSDAYDELSKAYDSLCEADLILDD